MATSGWQHTEVKSTKKNPETSPPLWGFFDHSKGICLAGLGSNAMFSRKCRVEVLYWIWWTTTAWVRPASHPCPVHVVVCVCLLPVFISTVWSQPSSLSSSPTFLNLQPDSDLKLLVVQQVADNLKGLRALGLEVEPKLWTISKLSGVRGCL